MTQERVSGFVMAIEDNGTIKVRVKQLKHPLDGKKLVVKDLRQGYQPSRGDKVTFLVIECADQGRYASDVVLHNDQVSSGLRDLVGTNDLLGIACVKLPEDGSVYYHLSYHESRHACQQSLVAAGSDEEVLFYLRMTPDEAAQFTSFASSPDEIEAGFRSIVALLSLSPVRDAFEAILTRFAEQVKRTTTA